MDHQQIHQEEHRLDRKEKQANERESERRFSLLGPTVRPWWFLAVGVGLTMLVIYLWTIA